MVLTDRTVDVDLAPQSQIAPRRLLSISSFAHCIRSSAAKLAAAGAYERLNSLSDAELQKRGLSRDTLVRDVSASFESSLDCSCAPRPGGHHAGGRLRHTSLARDMAVQPSRHRGFLRTLAAGLALAVLLVAIVRSGWSPVLTSSELDLRSVYALITEGDSRTLLLLAMLFVCAALSSTVGFAFSALAGAVIFHVEADPIRAVQAMAVTSVGLQAWSCAALWRQIDWLICLPFVLGGILTMPIGIVILLNLTIAGYVSALGLALSVYGIYLLWRPVVTLPRAGVLADMAVGGLGGLTGPLAAFPGAFVTIWCGMQGLGKVQARAIFQPYILIMQIALIAALWSVGGPRVAFAPEMALYLLPGIAGALVGFAVFRRLSERQFNGLIAIGLIVSGLAMTMK